MRKSPPRSREKKQWKETKKEASTNSSSDAKKDQSREKKQLIEAKKEASTNSSSDDDEIDEFTEAGRQLKAMMEQMKQPESLSADQGPLNAWWSRDHAFAEELGLAMKHIEQSLFWEAQSCHVNSAPVGDREWTRIDFFQREWDNNSWICSNTALTNFVHTKACIPYTKTHNPGQGPAEWTGVIVTFNKKHRAALLACFEPLSSF